MNNDNIYSFKFVRLVDYMPHNGIVYGTLPYLLVHTFQSRLSFIYWGAIKVSQNLAMCYIRCCKSFVIESLHI